MSSIKEDRRIYLLSKEKPAIAVIKLGVPLIAGMFIMVLYNLVDTYFIGLMRDDYQLAAVNLAYPVMMISVAVSNMIGAGLCVSLWFYLRAKTLLTSSLKYIRPTAEILREIFWVGVPASLETMLTSAAYIVNNPLKGTRYH